MQVTRYQAVQSTRLAHLHRVTHIEPCTLDDDAIEQLQAAEASTEVGADQPGRRVPPWERAERIAAGLLLLACAVTVLAAVASVVA